MTTGALHSRIEELFARPADTGVSLALVVLHDGEVVAERYGTRPANAFEPELEIDAATPLPSWSIAKSITHAAVGVLAGDGRLDVDAPAAVPEWEGTPKARITLLDLLEMRSGLLFVEEYDPDQPSHCIEMLFGDSDPSHAAYAAGLPLVADPGTVWNYSSGTTNIVARLVGDIVLGRSGGAPAERRAAMTTFLRERLFEPVGMTSAEPRFDDAGDFVGSSYVFAAARDFARFGELYRNDGLTGDGVRVLPEGWTDHARRQVATDEETGLGYGRHWWLWPRFPGSLAGHGYEGQYMLVVPDRRLVLVHLGKTAEDHQPALRDRLGELVLQLG